MKVPIVRMISRIIERNNSVLLFQDADLDILHEDINKILVIPSQEIDRTHMHERFFAYTTKQHLMMSYNCNLYKEYPIYRCRIISHRRMTDETRLEFLDCLGLK